MSKPLNGIIYVRDDDKRRIETYEDDLKNPNILKAFDLKAKIEFFMPINDDILLCAIIEPSRSYLVAIKTNDA